MKSLRTLSSRSLALMALLGVLSAPVNLSLLAESGANCPMPMAAQSSVPAPGHHADHTHRGQPTHQHTSGCCDLCVGLCAGAAAPVPLVSTVAVGHVALDEAPRIVMAEEVRPPFFTPHPKQLALPPPVVDAT